MTSKKVTLYQIVATAQGNLASKPQATVLFSASRTDALESKGGQFHVFPKPESELTLIYENGTLLFALASGKDAFGLGDRFQFGALGGGVILDSIRVLDRYRTAKPK